MGELKPPKPVKLFLGQLSGEELYFAKAEKLFRPEFGPLDYQSPLIPFNFTSYYQNELGGKILRKFVSFLNLIDPREIVRAKLLAQELEKELGEILPSGTLKRNINLDPGYLTLGQLILASTKNQQHRIYLRDGIYAEVTLKYRDKNFAPWEWTYPDYQSPQYWEIFRSIRKIYYQQLSEQAWL